MSGPSHEEKQFEKLMAQEAKADEKLINMAAKELKRAEKAYNKSVKVSLLNLLSPTHLARAHSRQESEKAEKAMAKLAKALTKTSKHQNAMEHKHKDAIVSREKAEKTLTVCILTTDFRHPISTY